MKKFIVCLCTVILLINLSACKKKEDLSAPIMENNSSQTATVSVPMQNITSQPQSESETSESEYTHAVYQIIIYEKLLLNNSVGNEWFNIHYCGEERILSEKKWTVPLNKTETAYITVYITEDDEHPDTSSDTTKIILRDGFETSKTITVTENGGHFKGNTATWEIKYRIKLVDRLIL